MPTKNLALWDPNSPAAPQGPVGPAGPQGPAGAPRAASLGWSGVTLSPAVAWNYAACYVRQASATNARMLIGFGGPAAAIPALSAVQFISAIPYGYWPLTGSNPAFMPCRVFQTDGSLAVGEVAYTANGVVLRTWGPLPVLEFRFSTSVTSNYIP